MLLAGDLDMGHARALLALDGAQQILSANEIVAKKLSVREAERLVARARRSRVARRRRGAREASERRATSTRIEQQLSDVLRPPSRSA